MKSKFSFPDWELPESKRTVVGESDYLDWLAEERARLIREGTLETVKSDVARRPVNARFVWPE